MKRALGLALLSISAPSWACSFAPPERSVPPEELIDRTKRIALAKVIRAETSSGKDVIYTFRTIRALKGTPSQTFRITGEPLLYAGQLRRFDNHTDPSFWTHYGGRLTIKTDCKIHPAFSVGGLYLIFLDGPYHVKSFESVFIDSNPRFNNDKWLKFVEGRIGP